jgi:hypothetical protein
MQYAHEANDDITLYGYHVGAIVGSNTTPYVAHYGTAKEDALTYGGNGRFIAMLICSTGRYENAGVRLILDLSKFEENDRQDGFR